MNSYQISSLAGTNYSPFVAPLPSLYFATQDNSIWASADGGRTWPISDCAEGSALQTWYEATSPTDPQARVAYGCTYGETHSSDANFHNHRDMPNRDLGGRRIRSGQPLVSFLLSPGNWMRFATSNARAPFGHWQLYLSRDNLEHWQSVGTTTLNLAGPSFRAAGPQINPTVYATFYGAANQSGHTRIALARFSPISIISPITITDDDLLYLPNDGSLGIRAAGYDAHAVYGLDPRNPKVLIAPDILNEKIWISKTVDANNRPVWNSADQLTDLVTQTDPVTRRRNLLLYGGSDYLTQVTEIAFSPYENNLILVGTRDAGVIYSDDYGENWHPIRGSRAILYVTGFFFTPSGLVYVSSYGRGLWSIDMRRRDQRTFPFALICGFNYGECIVRLPPDASRNQIADVSWKDYDVFVAFDGRVNGVTVSNNAVKAISLTPRSIYRYYSGNGDLPAIIESKDGTGFKEDNAAQFALKHNEVITGVILKNNQLVGYLTNKAEFVADQKPLAPETVAGVSSDKPRTGLPYLSLTTDSSIGPGLVETHGLVSLLGREFRPGVMQLRLDGKLLAKINSDKDGHFNYLLEVDEKLSYDQHRVEAVQEAQGSQRTAMALFTKIRIEDRLSKQPK